MNFSQVKSHILRGAGLFFPFAAILWGFNLALKIADGWFGSLITFIWQEFWPNTVSPSHSPIFSLVFLLVMLYTISVVVSWKLGSYIFNWVERRIYSIKGIGAIYSSLRKGIDMVSKSGAQESFKRVVWVPFTSGGGVTIAFVTKEIINRTNGKRYVVVMIPTPPNPISGLMVAYPEDRIADCDMSIDAALQMCMSLGIAAPESINLTPAAEAVAAFVSQTASEHGAVVLTAESQV